MTMFLFNRKKLNEEGYNNFKESIVRLIKISVELKPLFLYTIVDGEKKLKKNVKRKWLEN